MRVARGIKIRACIFGIDGKHIILAPTPTALLIFVRAVDSTVECGYVDRPSASNNNWTQYFLNELIHKSTENDWWNDVWPEYEAIKWIGAKWVRVFVCLWLPLLLISREWFTYLSLVGAFDFVKRYRTIARSAAWWCLMTMMNWWLQIELCRLIESNAIYTNGQHPLVAVRSVIARISLIELFHHYFFYAHSPPLYIYLTGILRPSMCHVSDATNAPS